MNREHLTRRQLLELAALVALGGSALDGLAACSGSSTKSSSQLSPAEIAAQQATAEKQLAEKQRTMNTLIKGQVTTLATKIDQRMQADRANGTPIATPINEIGAGLLIINAGTQFNQHPKGAYSFEVTGKYDTRGNLDPSSVTKVLIDLAVLDEKTNTLVSFYGISYDRLPNDNWKVGYGPVMLPDGHVAPVVLDTTYPDTVNTEQINSVNAQASAIESEALVSPPAPVNLPTAIMSGTGK